MKSVNLKIFFNWLLVFFWAGLIFFLSSQPDLKSGLPALWDFILRKLSHMAEYAILCFLIFRASREHFPKSNKIAPILIGAILSVIYAISDEYHQTFILGRQGSSFDVLIDTFGIMIAVEILDAFFRG